MTFISLTLIAFHDIQRKYSSLLYINIITKLNTLSWQHNCFLRHMLIVCRLKRSIYWLKQLSYQWYLKFDNIISYLGFGENEVYCCIYLKVSKSNFIFLIFYVDDILFATNDLGIFHETKQLLSKQFDMKDLREASLFVRRSWSLLGFS